MNDFQVKIFDIIASHEPHCEWEQLMDGLDYPERQSALRNVTVLARQGKINRVAGFDVEQNKSFVRMSVATEEDGS